MPSLPSISERRPRRLLPILVALGLVAVVAVAALGLPGSTRAARSDVKILASEPVTLDPALQSDAGTAQVTAQLYESLTAIDPSGRLEPALAASWEAADGGRRIDFHLRSGLTFSDGSPLRAQDVVASWLRVLRPALKSPLASLLDDVSGAAAYRAGKAAASGVGLSAPSELDVRVQLVRAASDFPAIVSGPSLAIVPAAIDRDPADLRPGSFVGSGAYVVSSRSSTELTLSANPHYWAGTPAIKTVHLVTDPGDQGLVRAYQAGTVDYTEISPIDASWIAYDRTLGPALRLVPSASVTYYGFDTTQPPFDDVRVRRAIATGVNWHQLVALQASTEETPAGGMVPPGIPGRSASNYGQTFDLQAARADLAAAGYPGGKGFPSVLFATDGAALDDAVIRQLHDNLGIEVRYEVIDGDYFGRLLQAPPAIWSLSWIADYPGANDFLGILLGTGQTNNFGHWSSPEFDADIQRALAASGAAAAQAAFGQAEAVIQRDAPVIPVAYTSGWALSANGLLGAAPNPQGIMRIAGMAWSGG